MDMLRRAPGQAHRASSHTIPLALSLAVLMTLIIGVAYRFAAIGQIRYGYDHSYPAYQALAWLDTGRVPLTGQPSSVFLDNPPLMVWIQALPLALVRSPLAVQVFILALNAAAVWFVYAAARDLLGSRPGLVAAVLFAVNAWVVYFSRTTWVQSLVPFFMSVAAWGLWPDLAGKPGGSSRRFLAGGVAVALMLLTYVGAWGVVPGLVILLVFARRTLPQGRTAAVAGLLLVSALLYAASLALGFEANAAKMAGFFAGSEAPPDGPTLTLLGFRHALRLVNGIDFGKALIGPEPVSLWSLASAASEVALTVALLAGVARAVLTWVRRQPEGRAAVVLLVWLLTPILLTLPTGGRDLHPHYLLITLPAGNVLAAWGLEPLWRRRSGQVAAGLVLALAAVASAHGLARNAFAVARNPVWPNFDGWSLAAADTFGDALRLHLLEAGSGPPYRAVATGHRALLSGMTGLSVEPVDDVALPNFVLVPAGQPLVYVLDGQSVPPALSATVVALPGQAFVAAGQPFRFAATRPEAAATLPSGAVPLGLRSETGLTLAGYELSGAAVPGATLDLVLYWRVDELTTGREGWYVSANAHVSAGDGALLTNVGEHGRWAAEWAEGDLVIERLALPIPTGAPPGPFRLSIGLGDPIADQAFAFLDGNARLDRVDLPLR